MARNYDLSDYVLTVNFENNSSEFQLRYRIYNHPSSAKWLNLIMKTIILESKIKDDGIFFGSGVVDKVLVRNALEKNIDVHNEFCKNQKLLDCIIPVRLDTPATQERLNLLHEYFEKYAEDPRFCPDPVAGMNLQDFNLNIHRMESCLGETDSSHVEILHHPRMHLNMEDSDYLNFTPDFRWGELYMTYGMTGVPTINAFYMKSHPTPQNVITNGMMMAFWGDHDFLQKDEMKIFLDSKGLDIEDPKIAMGYIPLGVMVDLEKIDRKETLEGIRKHPKIRNISLMKLPVPVKPSVKTTNVSPISFEPRKEASWPFDSEVLYHLDLVPYIDLNVKFDSKKLYQEAEKAISYFVSHRDYDQESKQTSGKWKSLGLRSLFGDYTKTQYHTSYTFEGEAIYKNTVFAELCPETMKFLETITDISRCERIRFMLLEPGASIKTHRDSQDKDVSFAVNISLNMPEGCVFFSQVNKDGSENPFSVRLPFKDSGSVLLFNNAKYHRVVNDSAIPRIHIIFHGPIKFSDDQLIKLARAQNQTSDYQDLIRRLMYKKNFMGEELTKTPSLFNDWFITGLRENSLPENYALAIYDHSFYKSEGAEHHLKIRTIPTLFPLKFDLIKENEWDRYLKESYRNGKEFAVIAASGTFFLNLHQFIKNLIINSQELKAKGWPAAGHLMDFNNGKQLPYFHEQFIIIHLKTWHDLGEIPLGSLYTDKSESLTAEISSETIHDDYTPLYIKSPAENAKVSERKGVECWGSKLIRAAVNSGKGVMNIHQALRNEKKYSYPRDENKSAKEEIERMVGHRLSHSSNEVFYFNNEPLGVLKVQDLKPNKIISVAAGFKPFQILNQFSTDENLQIHFVDFSKNALKYIEQVVAIKDYDNLKQKLSEIIQKDSTKSHTVNKIEDQLNGIIRSYFKESPELLVNSIKKARNAKFHEGNLIQNEHSLSSLIDKGDTFVIWVSNAFYNNSLYLLMTPEEANARLIALVKSIANKTGLKAYSHFRNHTFVFGENLDLIKGILTDGAATEIAFSSENWDQVI